MKKLLLSLLVLACVAPAIAATITFGTADVSVGGQATIPWTADAGVVGMALTVDASAGQIDADGVLVDSFFDVFIDSAFTAGAGYAIGDGVPTAIKLAAGELLLPSASFSISVGGLDDDGIGLGTEEAPLSGSIVLKSAAGATVNVCEDTLRGGVVGYDGAMIIAGLCQTITIGPGGPAMCGGGETQGFIDQWNIVAAVIPGGPTGWCAPRQCRGDANDAVEGKKNYYASTLDLGILLAAWNKPLTDAAYPANPQWINADFDRMPEGKKVYRVSTIDLGILLANWNISVATGVPAPCGKATGVQ